MSITTEQMTYEEMVRTAKTDWCAVCGSHLNVAWSSNGYILRCAKDLGHSTITRHRKLSEYEAKHREVYLTMDSKSLMTMPETQMLQRIDMAKFPKDLSTNDKKVLAKVAITYGFDPLMGEVSIYQGRPFVSIDGRYRKAQESHELDGVQTRPATKQEKEDWQVPEGDYFYRSEVYVKGASHPFVGWGRVYAVETSVADGKEAYLPVQKNPQRMAEKRAEAQALRKAFHIPLPSVEDIGMPVEERVGQVIDVTVQEVSRVPAAAPAATPSAGSPPGDSRGLVGDEDLEHSLMDSPADNTPAAHRQRAISYISILRETKKQTSAQIRQMWRDASPDLVGLPGNVQIADIRDEYMKAVADYLEKQVGRLPDVKAAPVPTN